MIGPQEPSAAQVRPRRAEQGSATVWVICILALISTAAGWALVWLAAQGARHSAERAADSAALAAATQALRRLATQSGQDPCVSASRAAQRDGGQLTGCGCTPLDCTVTVHEEARFLGMLAARLPGLDGLGPIEAASRAGPAGESTG